MMMTMTMLIMELTTQSQGGYLHENTYSDSASKKNKNFERQEPTFPVVTQIVNNFPSSALFFLLLVFVTLAGKTDSVTPLLFCPKYDGNTFNFPGPISWQTKKWQINKTNTVSIAQKTNLKIWVECYCVHIWRILNQQDVLRDLDIAKINTYSRNSIFEESLKLMFAKLYLNKQNWVEFSVSIAPVLWIFCDRIWKNAIQFWYLLTNFINA